MEPDCQMAGFLCQGLGQFLEKDAKSIFAPPPITQMSHPMNPRPQTKVVANHPVYDTTIPYINIPKSFNFK
jgi:hypothetical protein